MSRTHKDAPAARKSRLARRFADREQPFEYVPGAVPVTLWPEIEPEWIVPGLAADPEPWRFEIRWDGRGGHNLPYDFAAAVCMPSWPAEVVQRAELTAIAHGWT
jgi:hypothetical protein